MVIKGDNSCQFKTLRMSQIVSLKCINHKNYYIISFLREYYVNLEIVDQERKG